MSKSFRWLYVEGAREKFRAIENRVVAIRKTLSAFHQKGPVGRGVINDAVQLAETIERLCSLGQRAAAEDAFEIAERVEILISLLEVELDAI